MAAIPDPVVVSPEDVAIPGAEGRPLRAWHWRSPDPRALLVISHGLGEHAGLYRSFAEYLVPAIDVDVLGFDFRGHGRSPGRRGHLIRYEDLTDDLLAVTRWADARWPGLPRFVLGHSNGGVVAILAMQNDLDAARGLILSNPALRLKYQPPRLKLAIGHVLKVVAPWMTLSGPVPAEGLSSDPLQRDVLRNDRRLHTRLGAPLFFGMLDAGAAVLERASELQFPMMMVLGGDDPIIDPDAGRAFFSQFGGPDSTLLDLPGVLHDPLFDLDRGKVYRAIADWLLPRSEPSTDGKQASPIGARDSCV